MISVCVRGVIYLLLLTEDGRQINRPAWLLAGVIEMFCPKCGVQKTGLLITEAAPGGVIEDDTLRLRSQ